MDTNSYEPAVVELSEATTAVVREVVDMTELPQFFDRAFTTIVPVLTEQGVSIVGAAFARYHGVPTTSADLEVGFPTDRPVQPTGDVVAGSLPGGRAARVIHHGSYDRLGESWQRLQSWLEQHGHTAGVDIWEVYLTEPTPETDPATLRTELNWVLRS